MADYSAEIAALERALANDTVEVQTADGGKVRYANTNEIMKRISLLRRRSGQTNPSVGVVAFSRGE